jgi:imidazole glycerol-phosphate synthase subunit HisH
MIHIVDSGLGNIRAICNMLRRIGVDVAVASRPEDLRVASRVILPGVGAFDRGMEKLTIQGFDAVLRERALGAAVPTLGVCLGMQLLGRRSAEGTAAGLGWLDAEAVHLRSLSPSAGSTLRVPHMGWNMIDAGAPAHPLLRELPDEPRFYFDHGYAVRCNDPAEEVAHTDYGDVRFASIVARRNIAGVQFHPEKSHRFGMRLLQNFAGWDPG